MERIAWAGILRAHPIPDRLGAAAAHGYDSMSLSPQDVENAAAAGLQPADILAAATEHGIRIPHLDPIATWVDPWEPEDDGWPDHQMIVDFLDYSVDEFFDMADQLGVSSITALGAFPPGTHDHEVLVERFAALCDRAAASGIRVDLEWIPSWGIGDLETAWKIVRDSNRANAALCFDFWHFSRSHSSLDLLREIPGDKIGCVQVSDASMEPGSPYTLHDTLFNRVQPGDGDFEVQTLLRTLDELGGLRLVGPEVFSAVQDEKPVDECLTETTARFGAALRQAGVLPRAAR